VNALLFDRPWDNETSTWDDREDRVLQNYVAKLKDRIKIIFHINTSNATDATESVGQTQTEEKHFKRIILKMEEIMKYRFYVSCRPN